ncbi:C25 family cysteine peptidase [Rhodocytophaga aerolata]|uniref:C25 family cysteine peptidase n=1 Tax=Rhodocytophaga aerolata TaxID=455078 RepID=A0ABT8R405_9BACT|nr:C25 family cysteine peptidase [Rhodocytophaga aerolata]MDO1446827.1 C25 family cysteine peptidase [Rhodocytophaga aerolata]
MTHLLFYLYKLSVLLLTFPVYVWRNGLAMLGNSSFTKKKRLLKPLHQTAYPFVKFSGLISLLILFTTATVVAQRFGNEWINYNQQYYKIPITQKGIHRITYSDLSNAGVPVDRVDPRRIQVYYHGTEQAISINGEADAIFHPNDFIEFYGEGNDGTLDSLLYLPSSAQPHKYLSLYSDTASYFLSWRLDNGFGKRMESVYEANVSNITSETYHWDEKLLLLSDQFASGQTYERGTDLYVQMSQYDYGEGWTGELIEKFQSKDYTLTGIQNIATTAAKPTIEVLLIGRSKWNHNSEIFIGNSSASLRSLGSVQFQYNNKYLFTATVEPTDFTSGQAVIRIRSNGTNDNNRDAVSVSYIRLIYPQTIDAGSSPQKYLTLEKKATNKSFIEIANPATGTLLYDITDKHTVKRIGTNTSAGKLTAIVPNTANGRKLFANTNFLPVGRINKVGFRNINAANHTYIIISHNKLMKPAGGYPDAVKAYASYRASTAGGRYDTLVVDVNLLYNQYSYGEPSPLAIRRFADFLLTNGNPKFLFLIGRSQYPFALLPLSSGDFNHTRNPNYPTRNFVPTAGYPGSDIHLTAGLTGNPYVPSIPTGRINVTTPEQIINYLNKVIEHEATPADALWRKNLVHLSGGKNLAELRAFRLFVDDFKRMAEGTYLGGKVATFSKRSDNAVELINIADQVNKGTSLITFFGHSSIGFTDIEIGYVSDPLQGYRNKGKYPMILVNGCEAGDIFYDSNNLSFGEDWILAKDKGAVLFLAHSALGYVTPLRRYTEWFYRTAFSDSLYVGKPIGNIQKEVIRRFVGSNTTNFIELSHAQQFTLQGDPSLSLLGTDKPDYYTNDDQLFLRSFDNSPITAVSDSFQIGIITSNFGRVSNSSIPVTVRRTTSEGIVEQLDTVFFPPVFYQDTLFYTIRSQNFNAGGNNRFEVILDVGNSIAELNENNNTGVLEYFMPSVGAIPLYPKEYSIVNQQPVTFIAQTTLTSTENRQYVFELDTVHTFTSPVKKTATITAGTLPTWKTDLLSNSVQHDSTVYYWRIRFADMPADANNSWAESSFIYINNSPEGWSQSRFPQFSKSKPVQVNRNTSTETWEFKEVNTLLDVRTSGVNYPDATSTIKLSLNNSTDVVRRNCMPNTLIGVTFDKVTTVPYSLIPGLRCETPTGTDAFVSNYMSNGYLSADGLITYIDAIPAGDYVLLFTSGSINFSSWTPAMKAKLEEIGADPAKIALLQTGHPYIIQGRKGATPGTALEVLADYSPGVDPAVQTIALKQTITGRADNGTITSSLIGPASDWGTLYRTVLNSEVNSHDEWQLDVVGISLQGNEKVLYAAIPSDNFPLDFADAKQYPYMRLKLTVKDTTNLTPPQLNKWQVIYSGVPEGVINPGLVSADMYKIPNKQEGENFNLDFIFQNISNRNFEDSLDVQYTLYNTDTRKRTVTTFKIAKLAAGDTIRFSVPVKTGGAMGNNVLQVYVNPRIQAEQNYANNIFEVPFKVNRDNIHPVLDVAFDGVRIMDGDIVSPSPLITISLKDENKVLIRKDTVGMELLLKKPCEGCTFERVNFGQADLRWTSASAESNDFRIEYNPKNLQDGVYTLQVQGSDVSGNISGVQPYRISFEVVNESKITHFYPYPNPFSSNTRFVFTLTGSEIPNQIKIQIMTVTGKVVREITQDELGPIRIGNNISTFAWDGTDEFGDKLANGVYLYRVTVKTNGQTVERRQTAADKGFKKDFGKIYILR